MVRLSIDWTRNNMETTLFPHLYSKNWAKLSLGPKQREIPTDYISKGENYTVSLRLYNFSIFQKPT